MALYPPIVASSMPAFNINAGEVKIYFTLSEYNGAKVGDIRKVHVTVRRQSSNVNVLNDTFGIIEKDFYQSDVDKINNQYYIILSNSDIKDGFKVDIPYKVQLRFSTASAPTSSSKKADFYSHVEYFSEWSTVCIIKPVYPPLFYIEEFYIEGQQQSENDENYFNNLLADFVGIYKIQNTRTVGDQTETTISSQTLKKWRIRLLTPEFSKDEMINVDNYLLADSGWNIIGVDNYTLDSTAVNFECSLPVELQQNESYKLLFNIETRNGYSDYIIYLFTYKPSAINELQGTFQSFINEEQGYIKLVYNSQSQLIGNFVIRRTDSRSNFLKWEDLKNFQLHTESSYTYYDFTVQSGMLYKYLIQRRDIYGRRGTPVQQMPVAMGEWEHAFLLESNESSSVETAQQLKLKFDFQISSYKTNIAESKTDTIGSQYPFIRRNGSMYYRSFACSGTITGYMDNTDLFTSIEQMYDNNLQKYQNFQGNYDSFINRYDYTYERKFREKVEKFLYNSKPKLYKSMQQGNMLIKLMEISLTPKNELGRLIYSFSATAYQIDQASIPNFNKYGFIKIGTFNPNISYTMQKLGQVSSYIDEGSLTKGIFKAGQNIIAGNGTNPSSHGIGAHHNYNKPINGQVVKNFNITWLRITVQSDPYLIKYENGRYEPVDDIKNYQKNSQGKDTNIIDENSYDKINKPIKKQLYTFHSNYNEENLYLGTLFTINGQQIIVSPPNNIYELKDPGVSFTTNSSIIPAKDTELTIDYVIQLNIEEDTSNVPRMMRTQAINGQLIGPFTYNTQIIQRISYKYNNTYYTYIGDTSQIKNRIKQYVKGVKTINIDTDPGTIVEVKTSVQPLSNNSHRIIVNETGELFFDPGQGNVYITSFIIKGKNILIEQLRDRRNQYFNEAQGIIATDIKQILYPMNMDLFRIGDAYISPQSQQEQGYWTYKEYIYYKDTFYEVHQNENGSYDLYCPIDALIFYYIDLRRDIY